MTVPARGVLISSIGVGYVIFERKRFPVSQLRGSWVDNNAVTHNNQTAPNDSLSVISSRWGINENKTRQVTRIVAYVV